LGNIAKFTLMDETITLKINAWQMNFLFGWPIYGSYVTFMEFKLFLFCSQQLPAESIPFPV